MNNAPFCRFTPGLRLALAPVMLAIVAGCSQVGSKAHDLGSAFSGNYDTVANVSSTDAVAAVKQALQDLHLVFVSAEKDPDDNSTAVVAHDAQDQKITVTVVPQGATSSRIVVSTGVFGNATLRQQVMDAVRARLASTTQPGPTTQPTSAATHP